jgi:hypothetical protein
MRVAGRSSIVRTVRANLQLSRKCRVSEYGSLMCGISWLMIGNATRGAVIGGLDARRGTIIDSEVREAEFTAVWVFEPALWRDAGQGLSWHGV